MPQLQKTLDQFSSKLPLKPYCSDDLQFGLKVRPKAIAIGKRYIQQNHPCYTHYFVFDLDYQTAYVDFFYSMVGVPAPNLIVENRENGHAHFVYELETPIYNTDSSRPKPIQYGHAVYSALREVLQADVGYTGLITKNPLHQSWRTHVLRNEPYSLKQLADKLDLTTCKINKEVPLDEAVGLGRNCYLFHTVRHWAYIEIRQFRGKTYNAWFDTVLQHCMKLNTQFTIPMQHNEVKGIAKSISRWVWKRDPHCYAMFIERQSMRGRNGGLKGGVARSAQYADARIKAQQLKKLGMNNTAIANELGVDRKTVIRWFSKVGQ
jgi:hypothetical protein